MTKPQLRECPGCGLFQIVPAMEPGLRCTCTRCGTVLRATRANPLNRHLALTFAAMVLFAVVWIAMLMKVSTAGIRARDHVGFRAARAGRPRPVAGGDRGRLHHRLCAARQVPGDALCADRAQDAAYAASDARCVLGVSRLNAWCMLEVLLLGVFVAYTKLGDLVTIELGPAVYALGALTVVWAWAEVVFDPQAVWEEIERRGQTHAPMPVAPPLAWQPGAMGCEGCGPRLHAGRDRRPLPALRLLGA